MLLVQTKIGPSAIQGIGLFANQFIPKGTQIWKFQSGFDLLIDKNEISKLSEPAREQFLKYSSLSPKTNKYLLGFDDDRFWNHSDNPNCIFIDSSDDEEGILVSVKDIQKGEELTCNYKDITSDFDYKMSVH